LVRDASPVQRIVSPVLTVCAVSAALLATGDLRSWLLLAAVVAALPWLGPLIGILVVSSTSDWGENEPARPIPRHVAIRVLVTASMTLATAAILWYAIAPGVASYQLGTLLSMPALGLALAWLHRHLPDRWQWGLAAAIAPVGPAGYLVFGGSQGWAAYTLTLLPLCSLIVAGRPDATDQPGIPGWVEGPWGPP
jgi:hypothetical protein